MVIATNIRRKIENINLPVFKHVGRFLYWLKTHTYNRYHMLDIRNKKNGYSWGWLDRSEGILFANMAILVDFVEKEKAFESHVDWLSAQEAGESGGDDDPCGDSCRNSHAAAKKEMLEIYNWWKDGRKAEHDAYDALLDKAYNSPMTFESIGDGWSRMLKSPTQEEIQLQDQAQEMDDNLTQKDKDMMIRLINVSDFMWT
jgi:hypothetical protein